MRIISGRLGGRKIHPPASMPHTRPTTDLAKEGLFNILQNRIDFTEVKSLDLFGGTGCISYELSSRGAGDLTIVEKDPVMYQFISKTSQQLGVEGMRLVKSDVFAFIDQCTDQFNFIFAGPPYALTTIDELPVRIFARNLLAPGGWFILEHTPRNSYEGHPHLHSVRNYGTTVFSFFHIPATNTDHA